MLFDPFGISALTVTLARIESKINQVLANQAAAMQTGAMFMADFTAMEAAVTKQTTVVLSVETLLQQMAAQIAAIPTTDPATQAAIDGYVAQIEDNTARLSAAVAKNTPAA